MICKKRITSVRLLAITLILLLYSISYSMEQEQINSIVSFTQEDFDIFCIAQEIGSKFIDPLLNKEIHIRDLRNKLPDTSIQTKQGLLLLTRQSESSERVAPTIVYPKAIITPWGLWNLRSQFDILSGDEIEFIDRIMQRVECDLVYDSPLILIDNYYYTIIKEYKNQQLPIEGIKSADQLIPSSIAHGIWNAMKQQLAFPTLKKLCINYIKKQKEYFSPNPRMLSQDLLAELNK